MKRTISTVAVLAIATLAVAAGPPVVPATPASVEGIVFAQAFTLEEGYAFDWRAERPAVVEGYVVVLKVDPAYVYPRQEAEPVLYVGDQTVERVNLGYKSGHVIGIIPAKVDLAKAPVWFGTPDLPERVDAETIAAERAKADTAGIRPLGGKAVAAALAVDAEELSFADRDAMLPYLASLISQYAPDEKILAETFRLSQQ